MRTIREYRTMIDHGSATIGDIIGQRVKIGFLTLMIDGYIETPNDGMPNIWVLISNKGVTYHFTPYNGLERIN